MLTLLRAGVVAYSALLVSGKTFEAYPKIQSCLAQTPVWSCENTTAITNTCCSPTPGGLVLLTQYWNTYTAREKKGQKLPKSSWTIHGLWPDNCDGSYEQYCDFSRQYDPEPSPKVLPNGTAIPVWDGESIDNWIKKFGRKDLFKYMSKYWIARGQPNEVLWAHEFAKHATCTSTFDVGCYGPDYKEHQDVIDYFDAAVRANQKYPTFDLLASSGVVPSNTTRYNTTLIETILKSQTGAKPYLGCVNNGTVLTEVWYFSHVYGTAQLGAYKAVDSTTTSSCSLTQPIWYYERTPSSEEEVRDD